MLKILLIDLGSERFEINEPIGIGTLTSFVNMHNKELFKIDTLFFPISEFPSLDKIVEYDIIGLSTKIGSLNLIRAIDVLIKESGSKKILLLGDLLATYATNDLLKIFPESICVIGEGEVCFSKIITIASKAKAEGSDIRDEICRANIQNLAFISNGQAVSTIRQLVDLSIVPCASREYVTEIAKRGGIIRAEGSRGCAWGRCEFCAIQYKYCNSINWRKFSNERILNELEMLSNYGVVSPYYTDEDFVGNNFERTCELARLILKNKCSGRIRKDLNLYVDMRIASLITNYSEAMLTELKKAGLREIFIGIESGSKEQNKRYKKPSAINKSLKALTLLRKLDISFDIGFIMFDPEMNIDELIENINFIYLAQLDTHDSRMTKKLRIEPGTPILNKYIEKNLLVGKLDVDQLCYPYRWVNSDVMEINQIFEEWENIQIEAVYAEQAKLRGEVESEEIRCTKRKEFGVIRHIELNALKYITHTLHNRNNIDKSILHEMQDQRHEVIEKMANKRST